MPKAIVQKVICRSCVGNGDGDGDDDGSEHIIYDLYNVMRETHFKVNAIECQAFPSPTHTHTPHTLTYFSPFSAKLWRNDDDDVATNQ